MLENAGRPLRTCFTSSVKYEMLKNCFRITIIILNRLVCCSNILAMPISLSIMSFFCTELVSRTETLAAIFCISTLFKHRETLREEISLPKSSFSVEQITLYDSICHFQNNPAYRDTEYCT